MLPIIVRKILSSARNAALFVVLILFFLGLGLGGAFIWFNDGDPAAVLPSNPSLPSTGDNESEIGGLSQRLTVNAQLQVNGQFYLAPSELPKTAQAGAIVFDQATNTLQYFNGTQFVAVADQSSVPQQAATGVTSLQGQTGAIIFTPGPGIAINGLAISNSGILGVNGVAGDINVTTANGIATLSLPQPINTAASPAFAGLSLGSALTVGSGGTGATSLSTNGVIIGNGTGALTSITAGAAGLCLVSTAGAPQWGLCAGGGAGVASLDGLMGALDLANASGVGSTVTIDDASTTQKGIVQFNSTNFSVSGGVANTIQSIATSSSPTFAGLTLSSPLTVANGGTGANSLNNLIALGTHTTGSFVAGNTAGDGISVSGVAGEGWSPTIAVDATVCRTSGNCVGVGGGAPNAASYITIGNDGTLTNERAITAGTNLSSVDGGANGAFTLNVINNPTFSGLVALNGGLTVEAGDTLTFNGDAFTDLTGTGLTIVGNALQTTLGVDINLASSEVTGTLAVGNGGTGAVTFTQYGILYGNGTGAIQATAAGTTNQCLLATTGSAPSWGSCPGDGAGVTTVGALNGGTANTNGATITGSNLYLQSASTSFAGLVDTTTQSFAGDKTFIGKIYVNDSVVAGGASDVTQLVVKGNASQTANLLAVEDSSGNVLARISPTGVIGSADTTGASTNSASTTISSGNATGATSNTGSTTITTGNATSGTAGALYLNTGSSSVGAGTVLLGAAVYSQNIYIGAGAGATPITIQSGTSGTSLVSSGTINLSATGNITIGASNTTGTLLVLDTKAGASDPTGVNGGMYYNSSSGKMRCYESGAWVDCIGTGGTSHLTDAGAWTYFTSTSDEIVLGSSSQMSAKLAIVGTSNQSQLLIRANATQTNPLVMTQDSSGNELLRLTVPSNEGFFLGYSAGSGNTTYGNNMGIGSYTLQADGSYYNIAVGYGTMQSVTGNSNVVIGRQSMTGGSGSFNVGLGGGVLGSNAGNLNVALGHGALNSLNGGNNNISVGYQAGDNITTGSNNITIGHDLDAASATGSNQLNIAGLLTSSDYTSAGLTVNGSTTVGGVLTVNATAPNTLYAAASAVNATLTSTTNSQAGEVIIATASPSSASTRSYYGIIGTAISSSNNLSGASASLQGISASAQYSGTGTLYAALGGQYAVANLGSGTISYASGINVLDAINTGGGTISNVSGIEIANQTAATNNTNILIGTFTEPAGNWSIYNASSYDNYFGGQLTINGSILPAADDSYDLGSATNRWRDLYLGPASLHFGTNGNEAVLSYNTTDNYASLNTSLNLQSNGYLNFGGGAGSAGYGIRDNNGVLEVKDQGGQWLSFSSLLSGQGGGGASATGSLSPVPQIASYTQHNPGASNDPIDLQIPAGTQDGDLLIAILQGNCGDNAMVSAPSGWKLEDFSANNGCSKTYVYSRVASGDTPGSTRSWTNYWEFQYGTMLRITGANVVQPIHAITKRLRGGTSGTVQIPDLTTNTANTLGLAITQVWGSNPTDPVTGWSNITTATKGVVRQREFIAADTYTGVDTGISDDYEVTVVLAIGPAEQSGFYAGEALLQDNFDDNSLDAGKWASSTGSGGGVSETGQKLTLTLSGTNGSYAEIDSQDEYDIRGKWVGVNFEGSNQPTYNNSGQVFIGSPGSGGSVYWSIEDNGCLCANYWNGSSIEFLWAGTYNSTTHKYLRLREAGGITYWETSPDANIWSTQFARTNYFSMDSIIVGLYAGNDYGGTAGPSTFTFDDFYLGTSDQYIGVNTSNYVVLQGGNSFGSNLQIGTLDNYNLALMTGSDQVATFSGSDGSVVFRNSSNSTAAFQIINTDEDPLLTADTANMAVLVNGTLGVSLDAADTATQVCLNSAGKLATCTSSSEYKTNVLNTSYGMDELRQLQPVSFDWTTTGQADLGFLAEQVAAVIPQAVTYDEQGKVKSFNYNTVTALLVSGVKQLDVQIQSMDARLINVEQGNFAGNITVGGHIVGNPDTRGSVTVEAGEIVATYEFTVPYGQVPNIVLTPKGNPAASYWVGDITTTSFKVYLASPAPTDIEFNFQAQQ